MNQWNGKVAVITGAASGIGAGLVRHCVRLGMHVVGVDVDEAGLEKLTTDLQDTAGTLRTKRVDVTDEEQLARLAEEVFDRHRKVNLLFNNAGVLVDGKSWERSTRDWRWSIDVNVMGVIHGIKHFVPRMLEQGESGRVINTSSIGGLLGGSAYMAPYQGTKHMITALSESLYQELAMETASVSASVLCPGEVATGIWESDRLRPQKDRNVLGSDQEKQFRDVVAGGVAAGLEPDNFAEKVFAGIEAGDFWLLPQPEFKEQLERRHVSIIEGHNPASMAEMMEQLK